MAKVTSKLQVTLPKRVADLHGIAPGDEIEFVSAGDIIHIVPARIAARARLSEPERRRLFDEATARQAQRAKRMPASDQRPPERGEFDAA